MSLRSRFLSIARFGTLFGAALLALTLMPAAGGAANGANGNLIRTRGNEVMQPNALIQSTFKFTPGRISVTSGETLTFEHADQGEEPHTLTIVNKDELPATTDDVFNCGEPGTVCADAFNLFTQEPTTSMVLNAPGTDTGIDGRLDTLFVLPGESVSAPVTAPAGTTLYFLCLIHPWMQGEIVVK